MPARSTRKKVPLKVALTRIGARCSPGVVYALNGAFNYLHVGWWLHAHGYEPKYRVATRYELFDLVSREAAKRDVLYLEFGVHTGASIRHWSALLRSPRSHLHGFDSFQGLPHDWSLEGHERGYFSTGGAIPVIDDPRVEFFPGWFEETLPHYVWPKHDVLFAMLDADLYSSSATVLAFLRDHLVPGSFLYFDQFHHRCDELRAFAEFAEESGMRFKLVGATRELTCVLFQRLP